MNKPTVTVFESRKIYIEPNGTHLWKRWWHRLFFWRDYVYPVFKVKVKYVTIGSLERSKRKKK